MPNAQETYDDWNDFFTKKLVSTGAFKLSRSSTTGNTDIEIYTALKGNPDTSIEVGYFSSMTLIYIHILNPATPGKNRQQEIEYFYRYEFDEQKQYGPPGLDFNDLNLQGISNYLSEGFYGTEKVYYRKRKPVKSQLTTRYYPDSPESSMTYYFHDEPFIKRFLKRLSGSNEKYDEIRDVKLSDIFGGIKQ